MTFRTRIILSFVIIITAPFFLAGILYVSTRFYHEVTGEPEDGNLYETVISVRDTEDVEELVVDFMVSTALILVLTAIILLSWIYHGIVPRMKGLIEAAQRISDGELDFSIEQDGHDELSELADALEDMRMHLATAAHEKLAAEEEQRHLISNIAHDLKTPITAVKGYAEGLLDGVASTPEKQAAYLKTIQTKAAEMDSLINELSLYSQIDANRIPYHFRHLPAADYFRRQADVMATDLARQDVQLAYAGDVDSKIQIIVDPEQMNRVMQNIVSNSIKYMDKDLRLICMTVKDAGDFVQVDIDDNGKGISSADLPHIFERMYRADVSRNSAAGGSGLGLSIVKKIIEEHGGRVWAGSQEGEGTRVSFVLRKYIENEVGETPEPAEASGRTYWRGHNGS